MFRYSQHTAAGGSPTGADIRGPTYVVAASDSQHSAAADYTCDGVADEVQINQALNALPAGGGRVVLLDGTFVLSGSIVIPDDSVTLEGQGGSTLLNGNGLGNNEHAVIVSGYEYVTLKNFAIRTNAGGGNTSHCIVIRNGSNYARVLDIEVQDSDSDAILLDGSSISNVWIERVHVEGADNYGIHADLNDLDILFRLHISDCEIASTGDNGIYLIGAAIHQECTIVNNFVHSTGNAGIHLTFGRRCVIQGNQCYSNNHEGIDLYGTVYSEVSDNVCYDNYRSGIELDNCTECSVHDNICNDNDSVDTGNYDGISLFDSHRCQIQGNFCWANHRHGIYSDDSDQLSVVGNHCQENGGHGISLDSYRATIVGNTCINNSQANEGTFHGIYLTDESGAQLVSSNCCHNPDQGGMQDDGIHLGTHNNKVLIIGNYCNTGIGSGILLEGYCDDCIIEGNNLWLNNRYGIEIMASTCDRDIVKDNQFLSNVMGALLDTGTDTATHEIWGDVGFPDAVHGGRPVKELPDATGTHTYVTLQIPMDFHELVSANFVLVAEATGNAIFSVVTTWGKICANQQQDAHTDGKAATLLAMTDDELECFPLDSALDVAAIEPGDNIGIDFFRDGTHEGDELEATVNAIGVRLRYV